MIINELPSTLARELSLHLYSHYFKITSMTFWRVLSFNRLDEKAQHELCRLLTPMIVRQGTFVFEQEQSQLGIFVVNKGKVRLYRSSSETVLRDHASTGEVGGAAEQVRSGPVYAAATSVTLTWVCWVTLTWVPQVADLFGEIETIAELMVPEATSVSIPRYGHAQVTDKRGAELLCLLDQPPDYSLKQLCVNHPDALQRFAGLALVREEKVCQRLHLDLDKWVSKAFNDLVDADGRQGKLREAVRVVGRDDFEDEFSILSHKIYDERLSNHLCETLREQTKELAPVRRRDSAPIEELLTWPQVVRFLDFVQEANVFSTHNRVEISTSSSHKEQQEEHLRQHIMTTPLPHTPGKQVTPTQTSRHFHFKDNVSEKLVHSPAALPRHTAAASAPHEEWASVDRRLATLEEMQTKMAAQLDNLPRLIVDLLQQQPFESSDPVTMPS
jgi:hypothetical protein